MKNKLIQLLSILCFCTLNVFADANEDLIAACKKNDLSAAQKAIDAGADVNFKNVDGSYPLSWAFFSPEITKLLLEKKADPNLGNSPALANAAGIGSYEVMKLLIDAGANPNKPMIIDPSAGLQKIIADEKAKGKGANKYILKALDDQLKGMKSNPTTLYPISRVVSSTLCNECLDLLIEKGAKTDIINTISGGNLLNELAAVILLPADWIVNNKPQAEGWAKLGFELPEWYKNPTPSKLSSPDAMVKTLVKAGVDINQKNVLKESPLLSSLHRFSQTKSQIVLAFVNNGADINVENVTQGHALLQVAGYGYMDVLEAMFAKGADMNQEFKVDDYAKTGQRLKGITPLMWAVRNGKIDAVKYLVEKGAKLNEGAYGTSVNAKTLCFTSVKNKSAIFYAIESENIEIVKYLVENTSGDWKKKMKVEEMKEKETVNSDPAGIWKELKIDCIASKDYLPSDYALASKLDIRKYKDGKTQLQSLTDKKEALATQALTESDTLDPIIVYLKSKGL